MKFIATAKEIFTNKQTEELDFNDYTYEYSKGDDALEQMVDDFIDCSAFITKLISKEINYNRAIIEVVENKEFKTYMIIAKEVKE